MIKSFQDKQTETLFHTGTVKRLDKALAKKAMLRLDYLSYAVQLEDLKNPPSNRFHALEGFHPTRYSISVNKQWRISFVWQDGHAIEVCFEDYH